MNKARVWFQIFKNKIQRFAERVSPEKELMKQLAVAEFDVALSLWLNIGRGTVSMLHRMEFQTEPLSKRELLQAIAARIYDGVSLPKNFKTASVRERT